MVILGSFNTDSFDDFEHRFNGGLCSNAATISKPEPGEWNI